MLLLFIPVKPLMPKGRIRRKERQFIRKSEREPEPKKKRVIERLPMIPLVKAVEPEVKTDAKVEAEDKAEDKAENDIEKVEGTEGQMDNTDEQMAIDQPEEEVKDETMSEAGSIPDIKAALTKKGEFPKWVSIGKRRKLKRMERRSKVSNKNATKCVVNMKSKRYR